MIKSRRAKRMERNHKRSKTPSLNLVAFMDIFTLLVFFLLVNSTSTQHIPSQKELKLPVSFSKIAPEDALVIEITRTSVLVHGISVGTIDEILKMPGDTIAKLKDELTELSPENPADVAEFKISIMGDENSSYELIRKILTTCQQANYTKIAFVAMQSTKPKTL